MGKVDSKWPQVESKMGKVESKSPKPESKMPKEDSKEKGPLKKVIDLAYLMRDQP